jgi:diguanylate cyclase (GGDEF)-like protein/PAS domain S-box-containing protein
VNPHSAAPRAAAAVRILLVEDDPADAELTHGYLEEAIRDGIEVLHARTLEEAFGILATHAIDLALLDLDLPDSAGLQTLERFRGAARCPVVLVTGHDHPALRREALLRRAEEVLPKNRLDAESLMRVVGRLTGARRAGAAQPEGARQMLRRNERRFRALIENSGEAIALVDASGGIRYTSPAMRRILGYGLGDEDTRNALELLHPAERGSVETRFFATVAAAGSKATLRARFRHKDGSWRLLEAVLHNRLDDPDVAALVVNIADLTRQAQVEQRFRATFDQAAVGIAHLDLDDRFLLVNGRLCEILGYERDALIGRPISAFSHPDDAQSTREQRWRMAAGELAHATVEKRYLRRDGAPVWVRLTVSLVRDDLGDPAYYIVVLEDISERRAARAALERSEQRFRSLTEMSSDFYWETDEEHRLRELVYGPQHHTAIDLSRHRGLPRWEIPYESPDAEGWGRHRATLDARLPVRDFEFSRRVPSGEVVHYSISGDPLYAEDGAFLGYRGIGKEITDRKRSELSVRRLAGLYAAISAANEAILRAESREEMFGAACEIALESRGFSVGTVLLLDAQTRELKCAAASGYAAARIDALGLCADAALPGGCGMVGHAVRTGEAQISNDFRTEVASAARIEEQLGMRVGSGCAFPLRCDGAVVGAFALLHGDRDAFDEETAALMWRLADNISFALEGFHRDARRHLAEESLRESEERFRSLTALSSDWYWELDENLRVSYVSPGFEKLAGTTADKVLGRLRWETPGVTPLGTSWDEHRATLERRLPFREFEYLRTTATGERLVLSISGEPIFDAAGEFKGYRGTGRNDTRRRQDAEQLRRFRAALDVSPDMIFLVDCTSLRLIDVNDSVCAALGWSRTELLGQSPILVLADRSEEELRAAYEALLAGDAYGEPHRASYRRSDGSLMPVEVTRRALRTGDGVFVVAVARDLTERLKSEERLRHSIERFESVSRATNDVIRDWDLRTDGIWWNENFQRVFGWLAREVGAYLESWTGRIHPEDREAVERGVSVAVAAGEKSWFARYRFERRDGGYAVVEDHGLLMYDELGTPVRMISSMTDVTERVLAEERLAAHARRQESVARLGQLALERTTLETLFAEAMRVLKASGADAAVLAELGPAEGEFLVRAASGAGAEDTVGHVANATASSRWRAVLEEGPQTVSERAYFQARAVGHPWSHWLGSMGSAAYAPLRGDAVPLGVLAMYSLRENAFRDEDVRFLEAVGNVISTAMQHREAQSRLAYLAQFDTLTGLPNRNLLQDRLQQTVTQARRLQRSGAVLFIDLDRFKLVNDTLGHQLGDALIVQAGQRLQDCVRPGDTVGRVAGDEYVIVLAELAQAADAALIAQKILDALALPFALGETEAFVTASIGIAVFPADGEDAETLLRNADLAMYRAKESTRNAFCFFDAEMNRRSAARLQLNTDLRRAIERREFLLHYQPKVELASGALTGAEALLRWNHPQRGMVSPAEFIPALEESGQILTVGEWVLQEACAQLRSWADAGLVPLPVAVNLSAKQFQRSDLDAIVGRTLQASGTPAELIELEITESSLVEKPAEAVRMLRSLRAMGVKISVDDFGTGYSSLSYLTRLPLSALKIDRSFVRDAQTSSEAASIVRAVIDMAHNLGFTVVAEGVETEEQVAFLRRHGCDLGQGFLFARPMPADALGARLRRAREQT